MEAMFSMPRRSLTSLPGDGSAERLLVRLLFQSAFEALQDYVAQDRCSREERFVLKEAFVRWQDVERRLKSGVGPADPRLLDLCVNDVVPQMLARYHVRTVLQLSSPPNKVEVVRLLGLCEEHKLFDATHLKFLLPD